MNKRHKDQVCIRSILLEFEENINSTGPISIIILIYIPLAIVCTDIKIVTKKWGNEISWTFGNCASGQVYGNRQIYTEECCQEEGNYELACKDSYGDGWNGGFLEINGEEHCRQFRDGHEEKKEVTMSGTTSIDQHTRVTIINNYTMKEIM